MAEVTSCIFLTMPTSGTGSLWRLLSAIARPAYEPIKIAEQYEAAGRGKELVSWQPEPTGKIYMYNTPHYVNPAFADLKFKLITNFRDPRDLACNQFHWSQSHPMPNRTEEEIQAHRTNILAAGIDAFVLKTDNNILFRSLRALDQRVLKPGPETLNISYAQLCLDFDEMVARIIAFLGIDPAGVRRDQIELERTVNLKHNPNWIGQLWTGTDIMPGRHRGELKPETIRALNDKYRDNLKFVRGLEVPRLRAYLATEAEQEEMNRVAVGRQDQLFLKNDANNTIGQVTGETRLPERELLRIGMSHRSRQIFGAEVAGFAYGHAIVPSKEVAHRADLPEEIVFEQHGPRPIMQYLASPAAKLWQPFYDADLLTPKGTKRYFPKTDTHWNHEAAMLYFGAFLRHVMPSLAPLFDAVPLRRFPSEQRGDLGMKLELPAEPIEIVAVERSGARAVFENGINNEGCVRLYRNDHAPLQKKLFVMHDSFTSWLIQNISAVFRDVLFFHGTIFDYDFINIFHPDLVLCLQAERFFVRAPETGGDMFAFIAQQEKEKSARIHFADLLATF